MKIAYLIPGCSVSGGIAVVCQHANRLLSRGHEVILVCERGEAVINWFPQQHVPIISLKQYPDDVDILIATGWSTAFRVANLPAKNKCYFVQSDETRFHPPDSLWQHLTALSYCFDFHFLTEARWIQSWLLENFGKQAQLVPNGLDRELFFPCTPLEAKGKRPRILLEGAIDLPYKGMAEAFEVVKPLDVEVWCVSSYGSPKPSWKCDRFFEQFPMDKMREIYSSCDILLKLSRVEGFFGPPMEMMACGGVSVVGNVTGHDEYIVDGYNALVVNPFDIDQARRSLQILIQDKNLYEKLKGNGFRTVLGWDWEFSIDNIEVFYEKLTNSDSKEYKTYKTDFNCSISSIYYTCTGEKPLNNNDDFNVITNADKLCRRLKNSTLFKWTADAIAVLYSIIKKFR